MSGNGSCARCGKRAGSQCARCKRVWYCGQECQVGNHAHWRNGHKGQCAQWTSGVSATLAPPKEEKQSQDSEAATTEWTEARLQKLLRFKDPHVVSCRDTGLANVGNTCFVNSVVQALLGSKALVNMLLFTPHNPSLCKNEWCIHCELKEIAQKLTSGEFAHFTPVSVLRALPKLGDFQLGAQADAHELLGIIIERLHERERDVRKASSQELPKTSPTAIESLFRGTLRSVVHCNECGHAVQRNDPLGEIAVELPMNAYSIEEAFASHFAIESLDDYTCDKCRHKGAKKQMLISKAPQLLIVQLKRFDMMSAFLRKINKNIVFAEHIDLTKHTTQATSEADTAPAAMYQLYGMIVHYGESLLAGHYTALVKHDDAWRLYDDEKVSRLPNAAVALKQNPYVLLYERIDGTPSTPKPTLNTPKLNQISNPIIISKSQVYAALETGIIWVRADFATPLNAAQIATVVLRIVDSSEGIIEIATVTENSSTTLVRYPIHLSVAFAEKCLVVSNGSALLARLYLEFVDGEKTEAMPLDTKNQKQGLLDAALFNRELAMLESSDAEELVVALIVNNDQKLAAAQAAVAKANIVSRSESTYEELYKEIARAWDNAQSDPGKQARQYIPPTLPSVGRNETCPCGSGRKFKVCHATLTSSQ